MCSSHSWLGLKRSTSSQLCSFPQVMLNFRRVDDLPTRTTPHTPITRLCIVEEDQAPLPRPPQIDGINVTETSFLEEYEGPSRAVRVNVSLAWTRPVIVYGLPIEYNIYLSDGRVLSPDEREVPNKYLTRVCGTYRIR